MAVQMAAMAKLKTPKKATETPYMADVHLIHIAFCLKMKSEEEQRKYGGKCPLHRATKIHHCCNVGQQETPQ